MQLAHIFVFSFFALIAGSIKSTHWRLRILLIASLLSIFWLQPSTPIRNLDFWLPFASIFMTGMVWAITRNSGLDNQRTTRVGAAMIVLVILAIGLTRYFEPLCCLTPSRPPDLFRILTSMALAATALLLVSRLARLPMIATLAILLILACFIILKTEPLARATSATLRGFSGQAVNLASALDIPWLGFSYLSFRLLHVLREFQSKKLPELSFDEFFLYVLFFPAFVAGPIDRASRFLADLRHPFPAPLALNAERSAGLQRILFGVLKKFALGDSLALIALNQQNALQVSGAGWNWVLLYAYSLRIYFDFAGYTDIAIGLAQLLHIRLPENFDHPYLKTNLTAFWNSWHITLAQWFRAYFFNPFTRALRVSQRKMPTWSIILIGQLGTMVLIGLWHGVTWNFLIWGAWHGSGLFIHNRWSDWLRPYIINLPENKWRTRLLAASGWFITFHFVTLGWVWFALPDPATSLRMIFKLLGN